MVKVSTLFHRVDGFDESELSSDAPPDILDQEFEDRFLRWLLEPLEYDPGDALVKAVLQKT